MGNEKQLFLDISGWKDVIMINLGLEQGLHWLIHMHQASRKEV